MKRSHKKIRIGVLGCGAIGSRIAKSCRKELKDFCTLSALYDVDHKRAVHLAQAFGHGRLAQNSVDQLLKTCDLMVEATNATDPRPLIRRALLRRKDVLVMSAGKILRAPGLLSLAQKQNCRLLVPSGAIAGIDAVKAARLVKISRITLTTRKPVSGFKGNLYLQKRGINPESLKKETVLFAGKVDRAVKYFPQNINVAAVLALASGASAKIRIRILTSPAFRTNSHEIELLGDFGRIVTRTENVVCPDNPKTSYLAVLSAIATLKNFCGGIGVGT